MRLLALLLLAFGPSTELPTQSAAHVEVTSTSAGPLTVWLENSGVVKANGHVVTDAAVRIGVASTGDHALVVWTEANGAVRATRRMTDGSAAGAVRRIGSNAVGPVAIVESGDQYLVAWVGSLGEIYAAIVSSIGVPIVPAMPVTTQSDSQISEIAVAASDIGFAVVWHDLFVRRVFAATLRGTGMPVSMTPLLVSDDGGFPDITSDGKSFFIVWGVGTIRARTLTVEGELGRVRTVTAGVAPRIAWDGSAYEIAFAREVYPRPGFSFPQLMTRRITVYGTIVGWLSMQNSLLPGAWDVDARSGRLDLAHTAGALWVQSATVGELGTRVRAVRH